MLALTVNRQYTEYNAERFYQQCTGNKSTKTYAFTCTRTDDDFKSQMLTTEACTGRCSIPRCKED